MSFGQAVLLFFTYLGHWDGLNDYFKNSLLIELRYVTTYYVNFCAYFSFVLIFLSFFKGGTASGFYTVEDPVSTAIVFKLNSEISYWYIKSFQFMNSCFHQVYPTRLFRILKTSKLQLEPVSCFLSVVKKITITTYNFLPKLDQRKQCLQIHSLLFDLLLKIHLVG